MNNYAKFNIMQSDNKKFNYTESAISLLDKHFSNSDIINILNCGTFFEKTAAILNIKNFENEEIYAQVLNHLTNQEGQVRESVSYKLFELKPEIINSKILVDALCDVNPTVAKNIIAYLKHVENGQILDDLCARIEFYVSDIEANTQKFRKNKEKNHIITKKIFHLYWLLEAYCVVFEGKIDKNMENILQKCSLFYDYTIREKTAKILIMAQNPPHELLEKLKSDENFYVRNLFLT